MTLSSPAVGGFTVFPLSGMRLREVFKVPEEAAGDAGRYAGRTAKRIPGQVMAGSSDPPASRRALSTSLRLRRFGRKLD